jgi:Ca2+-binding RTX toxin-like protein
VDVLIGGAGADQLYGSTGADLLYGGDFDPLALDDAALFVLWQTFLSDSASALDELESDAADDPAIDTVHGEGDADWYLVYANDIFKLASERKAPNTIRQL